jgi:hypothetical protein
MRVVVAIGLGLLFGLGAVVGLVLGALVIFWISLVRGARAVHADGAVCQAELVPLDARIGPRLAGPALVRLSGAFAAQDTRGKDVLGLDLRLRAAADADSVDATRGDQDLLLGTFESFHTAAADRDHTNAGDYLANGYSSVTPWWVPGLGPAILRIARAGGAAAADPGPAATRVARLDAAIAADRARLTLSVHAGSEAIDVAEVRLRARLPIDGHRLRVSMFRQGRAIRPVGFRNGIRATVYPISELGRRLRGG